MSRRTPSSVGHVLWSGNVGGIERLVHDLAAEQVRQGLRVLVAFGRAEGPFVDRTAAVGGHVVDLGLRSGYDVRPLRVLRGGRSLRDVEIVHLHGFNPALAYTCLASRRPIVFTEHGNFALGRRLGRRERFKRRLQRRFLERRASAVVANSRHTAVRISELYGIPSQRIETVHNGTSFPDLRPSEHPENGQLRIVFLGRLVPFKRVDRLLEGVARSTRRDRLRLDIIGSGPLERDLKAMAESLGLGDRIRFLGQRMDVHELVAKADVIVQPSEGEPFGLSILEGCAHGALPIVFADGGGALEVIPRDAVTVESIDHLARALDELADFPTALDLAARRRRVEWVRERFAISVSARRYLAVYERAVAGR